MVSNALPWLIVIYLLIDATATRGREHCMSVGLCLPFHYSLMTLRLDNRPCREKLQGPFMDEQFNFTRHVLQLRTNENNSVTVRCRIVCQEANAFYTPQLRIVTTEDGKLYEKNWGKAADLFEVNRTFSDNRFACDPARNTT